MLLRTRKQHNNAASISNQSLANFIGVNPAISKMQVFSSFDDHNFPQSFHNVESIQKKCHRLHLRFLSPNACQFSRVLVDLIWVLYFYLPTYKYKKDIADPPVQPQLHKTDFLFFLKRFTILHLMCWPPDLLRATTIGSLRWPVNNVLQHCPSTQQLILQ